MATTPITTEWDVVYAINYTTLNNTLANQWQPISIDNYQQIIQIAGMKVPYTLNATFAPWKLTVGGDGRNVRFNCPISSGSLSYNLPSGPSGSYTFPTPDPTIPTYPTTIEIELELEWIPDPSQEFFVISDQPTVDQLVPLLNGQTAVPSNLVKLFADNKVNLSSSATVTPITLGLEWSIQDGKAQYYILYTNKIGDDGKTIEAEFLFVYQFSEAWKANLTVLETDVTTGDSPPVTVWNVQNSPIPVGDASTSALSTLMTNWFNSNLNQFAQIFAQADITLTLDQNNQFNWLVPSAIDYAVTDTVTLNDGVFGMLIMTGGRGGQKTAQVPQNAIPDGCDAAFIINGPVFVENMLLPGAMAALGITDSSYFTIDDQGLQVLLAKDYSWGPFITDNTPVFSTIHISSSLAQVMNQGKLDDGVDNLYDIFDYNHVGYEPFSVWPIVKSQQWLVKAADKQFIVEYGGDVPNSVSNVYKAATVTIPANQFSLTLNNDQIQLQLTKFSYPYPASSDLTISINYTENWTLGLKEVNGQNIFWFTDVSGQQMTTTVTQNQSAITREIVEGVIGAVILLISSVAAVGAAFRSTAAIAIDAAANEGTALIQTTEEVEQAVADNAAEVTTVEATNAVALEEGYVTRLNNVLSTSKWKVVVFTVAAFAAAAGLDKSVDSILTAIAQNNPQANLPDFDTFVEATIKPYTWPGVTGFDLETAYLANALVIGLKAQKPT